MASIGTIAEFARLHKRLRKIEKWQRKADEKLSDLSKQEDRLDADIPILTKQLADEDAQIAADASDIASAKATVADLQTQKDAVAATDAAEAARLQGQIDALEKLIKVAAPPAVPPGDVVPAAP